jgi:hypothetical protein
MDDADVDKALAGLWPPGAFPRLLDSVRSFIEAARAKGRNPETTSLMLRNAMAAELAGLGLSDHDIELFSSTFNRAVDRIVRQSHG